MGVPDCKIEAGSDLPFLSLSFVISSKNFFEIESMVEVAHEAADDGVTLVRRGVGIRRTENAAA